MFMMFKEQNHTIAVSYEIYRCILNSEFNISFGYPRTDTFTTCDECLAKLKTLSIENDENEITNLTTMNVLHKKKKPKHFTHARVMLG